MWEICGTFTTIITLYEAFVVFTVFPQNCLLAQKMEVCKIPQNRNVCYLSGFHVYV